MMDVVYVGLSDARELSEEDFKKVGVDHKDERFERGVAKEVSNELAKALLSHPLVTGEFVELSDLSDEDAEKMGVDANPDSSALLVDPQESTDDLEVDEDDSASTKKAKRAKRSGAAGATNDASASSDSSSTTSSSTAGVTS